MNENDQTYILRTQPNEKSKIKNIVAVISGKGGVGKSFTTSYLAVLLNRLGYKVGILDGDITGPTIPYAFNVKGPVYSSGTTFDPISSNSGIQIMSSNLLLDNQNDPLVWRGAMISQLLEQFYTDVVWDVDYLIIDMAPGTSDIALTIFQKIKLTCAVLVTSPQSLVSQIVEKSAKMANMLNVPLLSLVNNMAYIVCENCKSKIDLFSKGKADLCQIYHIPIYDEIPFDHDISYFMDQGKIEDLQKDYLRSTVNAIIECSNF